MYRDRDDPDRRKREGRHTAYDYAVDRDLKALAWAIRANVRYTPAEEKAKPSHTSRHTSRHASPRAASRPLNAPRQRDNPVGMASPNEIAQDRICRHALSHALSGARVTSHERAHDRAHDRDHNRGLHSARTTWLQEAPDDSPAPAQMGFLAATVLTPAELRRWRPTRLQSGRVSGWSCR